MLAWAEKSPVPISVIGLAATLITGLLFAVPWASRLIILSVFVGVTFWAWWNNRRFILMTPAYLLGIQAYLFFSLIPAALGDYINQFLNAVSVAPTYLHDRRLQAEYLSYLGTQTELLILIFVGLCFAITPLIPNLVRNSLSARPGLVKLLIVIAALSWGATLLGTRISADTIATYGYWSRQFLDSAVAITAFALALLHVRFLPDVRRHMIFLATLALMAAILVAAGKGKFILVLMASIGVSALMFSPLAARWKRRLLPFLALLVVAGLVVFGFLRDPGSKKYDHMALYLTRTLVSKVVDRQIQTGWCFANVTKEHFKDNRPASALNFLAGPVPRLLWPDKPSLSTGSEFGQRYCGLDKIFYKHSASITLLGEPVVQAGAFGLVVAVTALLISLGCFAWLAARLNGAGHAMLIAMIPWLMDFDQSLSMYFGNAMKCLIVGAPFVALLWWMEKRHGLTASMAGGAPPKGL